jgi:hypothetical protein
VETIINITTNITLARIVHILLANNDIKVASIPKITKIMKLENNKDITKLLTCAAVTSLKIKVNGALINESNENAKANAKKSTNLAMVAFVRLIGLVTKISSVPSSRYSLKIAIETIAPKTVIT